MDVWLDGQGLYRKNTALDGTCLFRAVADQLFSYHVPNGHILLREECVKFMRENRHLFESKVSSHIQCKKPLLDLYSFKLLLAVNFFYC